jgi:hypothetical protein
MTKQAKSEKLLTMKEAANISGYSQRIITKWVEDGVIDPVAFDDHRILARDLREFLTEFNYKVTDSLKKATCCNG